MQSHRAVTVAFLLTAAWLTGACQSSPLRPSQLPLQPPPVIVPPAQTAINVTGLVVESAGDPDAAPMPVSGATISIAVDVAGSPLSAVTDENGWFELAPSRGTVTVTVTKEGYETLVQSMDLMEDTTLNLELKRAA
jgi:hypothetical protein